MAGTGDQGGAAINVVPLIDIVLVLLIIFMVVTPMLSKGMDVKLPKATNVVSKDARTTDDQIIAVTAGHELFLMKTKVSEAELKQALKSLHDANPQQPILVKGDEHCTYGEVRKIILMAQEAGFKMVQAATEAKADKSAPPPGGG
jgi:biopolymer transport protein TolR